MVRSSGGFTCTCSECETCAELALARANRHTAAETTNIFGKRVTGHPQFLRLFWHIFACPAMILMRR